MNEKMHPQASMAGQVTQNITIAIIENNKNVLATQRFYLEKAGYAILVYETIKEAQAVIADKVDLIVMDLHLPNEESLNFVHHLREKGIKIPVIFVSGKNGVEELEAGYLCGGDDYIKRPFAVTELLCRIKAILKRTKYAQSDKVKVRDLVMDFVSRKIFVQNSEVILTRLEYKLLELFIQNKNRVLERRCLLETLWCGDKKAQDRTANVAINRLRKKIDPTNTKNYIVPVRGIGYRFQ